MSLVVRPWARSSDLLDVWSLFFSTGPDAEQSQRKACDIVQIWQHRSTGKLPHQILSTAALVDAQLHDRFCITTSFASVRSISAVHAMALLSFITGTTDIEQTKEHKVSMFDVAKTIGLPIKLVEIRHVIVHQGVPSLAVLREATNEALQWLRDEYWAKLVASENRKLTSSWKTNQREVHAYSNSFQDIFAGIYPLIESYAKFAASEKATVSSDVDSEAKTLVGTLTEYCKNDGTRIRVLASILGQSDYLGSAQSAWKQVVQELSLHNQESNGAYDIILENTTTTNPP